MSNTGQPARGRLYQAGVAAKLRARKAQITSPQHAVWRFKASGPSLLGTAHVTAMALKNTRDSGGRGMTPKELSELLPSLNGGCGERVLEDPAKVEGTSGIDRLISLYKQVASR